MDQPAGAGGPFGQWWRGGLTLLFHGGVQLLDRWPLPTASDLAGRLVGAYGDPRRGYHDLRHLTEVLDRLDELQAAGASFEPVRVRLAAWFHDAVHEGLPGDEESSARWAEEALTEVAVEPSVVADVARLVRLTEHHDPADGDLDGAALCDADLAILAAPPGRYAVYVADVRREYAHVPDRDFALGRTAVLRDLLAADRLFRTAHGVERWEQQARHNVEAELVSLASLAAQPLPPVSGGTNGL